MASTLSASVVHWRKKLERSTDEDVILNVIHKLSKVPMTLDLLQETAIGKVIRSLSKKPGKVGIKASAVLNNWRAVLVSVSKDPETSPPFVHSKHKSKSGHDDKKSEKSSKKSSSHTQTKVKKLDTDSKHNSNGLIYPKNGIKKELNSENIPRLNSFEAYMADPKSALAEENEKSSRQTSGEMKRKIAEVTNCTNGIRVKKPKVDGDHLSCRSSGNKNGIEKPSNHDHSKKKSHLNGSTVAKDSSVTKSHSHKHSKKVPEAETPSPKKPKKNKDSEKANGSGAKKILNIQLTEAFTSSEACFEDCLNFSDVVKVKKKKSSKSSSEKKEKHSSGEKPKKEAFGEKPKKEASGEKSKVKSPVMSSPSKSKAHNGEKASSHDKKTLPSTPSTLSQSSRNSLPKINEVDILSTLPQPQPNYRPLPPRNYDNYDHQVRRKVLTNEDAIKFTSSRRERTNVYSGRKNIYFTEVPSLFQSCIRILIENLDAIEYMGGAPYFLLKTVLERCTPAQLENIEHFNPYLLEDTHELWEIHCKRDFRSQVPGENETWRDLYWRAHEEREKRLMSITKNITENISKSTPGRLVKLAYVDSVVKPPREVARRQAKNGTALPVNHPMKPGPPSKATPRPTAPATNSAAHSSREFVPKKPKIAPLMAKTLKSMKQCFRR